MSVTFDAMLIFALPDRDGMCELNRLLHIKDEARRQTFNEIDMDHAGGSKVFAIGVYAACFNHFIPDDVEDCIAQVQWRYPQWVLYVCDLGDYHQPDYGDDPCSLSSRTIAQIAEARSQSDDQRLGREGG